MLDGVRRYIIALVKSAISGEAQPLPDGVDIEDVLEVAKKHQIQCLIYYGALNCGIDASAPAMQKLFIKLCKSIAVSERQMYEVDRICAAFGEGGIDHMPLKGTLLKKLYPRLEMRAMGDADILIRTEDYERIKPIMLELGFAEKLESDHELVWVKPELFLELHKRLIPSYNQDYYAYYGDGWRLALPCDGAPHRFEMSDEDQMIYLFTHFAKHYRDGGIGIRHLVDLYVYRKANADLDEEYIQGELEKLSLYPFYVNILRTLAVWFEHAEPDQKTMLITDFIFNSGVYGQQSSKVVAQTVRASKKKSVWKNAKAIRALELIFPSLDAMQLRYTFLRKAPYLLPVAWVLRFFRTVFGKTKKVKSFCNDMQSMDAQDITDYQQALNFVGLDFNFKE